MADAMNLISEDEQYLRKHHLLTYVEDGVAQLVRYKEEHPQVNPNKFLHDYFTSVHKGNHILYREYSFVRETPYNRSCFIAMFSRCFHHLGEKKELFNAKEYHSLLTLICADFPPSIVEDAIRLFLGEDVTDLSIIFSDFLMAFQFRFFYDEFVEDSKYIFDAAKSNPISSRSIPATENFLTSATSTGENLSREEYFAQNTPINIVNQLYPPSDSGRKLKPSIVTIQEVIADSMEIDCRQFLISLAQNVHVRNEIGYKRRSKLL
ncbi:uncharacterized protein TRIADDRAFT_52111 [Trichoplax adhaerens]|uniref:Centriolar satellite-associated tubulin polyglutamylase complex regulator 1 n=1 Tax=Trichoplax adhaerens TaxID=10228 RepID=B3RLT2_TRIAD|nr:hypothetical protein TRIADDRAFT_52111 [Trichoplax adhaerens]EDV28840.1 hypothetical protein TRIADDRAFT_52111 [Trichoplax adhaerens]|eukprot:XP_002108042.1 hypothetical protein TRIADDRAFT_52111 [Trichoplax adhaerens]